MKQGKLRWENISVTTPIPELVVCPDHKQVFMFSAVTWNRHHIHYSKDAAISEGLPDVVVQRGLIGNFLARLIKDWVGDSGELQRLAWKVTRSAVPGKDIVCRARITEKFDTETKKYLICEVSAFNEKAEPIASGEAMVVFTNNPDPS